MLSFRTIGLIALIFTKWFAIGFVLGIMLATHEAKAAPTKHQMKQLAGALEWKHHIRRGLLRAICEQETRWKLRQRSHKGALGVCQIMPTTYMWLVKEFQADHGLVPDGIVGPKTWAKLYPGRTFPGYKTVEQWLFMPHINMEWAARYLAWLAYNYGADTSLITAMYYAGAGHDVLRYVLETRLRLLRVRGEL